MLDRHEERIALAMVLVYVLVFGSLSLVRHWAFHSTALDLGVFDQVLWNTVHGRFMESTLSLERCDPHSFFLDHFSPALLLIVPFYAVVPRPETLIVFQTAALALGAWPVYLLARHFLPRGAERLIWVALYVLSAPLAWITFYDFHEITLAVVPLGLAMYFLATRRTIPLLLSLGASFLVKEELPLIAIGFGLALLAQRRFGLGAFVAIASAAWFVVTLKIIIPAFAGGAPYQYLGRYASLGSNELEIARNLVLDPLRVIRVLLSGEVGSKVAFVLTLFAPGLFLALRARSALIPSIVPLGYLLLSDYGGQHTHHNQYGAPVIPLALGASILGFATLRGSATVRRRLTGAMLASAVAFSLVHGAIPFTPDFYDAYLRGNPNRAPSEGQVFAREPRYEPFLAAVAAIPADASISSRDFFTTQVPERRFNYHLNGLDPCGAEYVILDYADPSVNRDERKHLAEVATLEAQGYNEIASGKGLSLLRQR
ncbi:MAG: DUF2079 domain-containing protein [Chloroflexi bacterium]|nr:MAG: DUF2079 domain-containing protein [Chloroflexota bacterium]